MLLFIYMCVRLCIVLELRVTANVVPLKYLSVYFTRIPFVILIVPT